MEQVIIIYPTSQRTISWGSFLKYKFPTWGITFLGAVGLVSSLFGFMLWGLSSVTPGLPSNVPRVPPPLVEIALWGYFLVVNFFTFVVAIGLLIRWNIARLVTMILAPAPFVGSILVVVHQSLVRQLIGTPNQAIGITQLVPLGRLAVALMFTGVSFPGLPPVVALSGYGTDPIIILFGLLNLGILFYLANENVKSAFRKKSAVSSGI